MLKSESVAKLASADEWWGRSCQTKSAARGETLDRSAAFIDSSRANAVLGASNSRAHVRSFPETSILGRYEPVQPCGTGTPNERMTTNPHCAREAPARRRLRHAYLQIVRLASAHMGSLAPGDGFAPKTVSFGFAEAAARERCTASCTCSFGAAFLYAEWYRMRIAAAQKYQTTTAKGSSAPWSRRGAYAVIRLETHT